MTRSIVLPAVLLFAASGCASVRPVTGMKCGEDGNVPMGELLGVRPCGELQNEGSRADDWMDYLLFHHLATHRTADLRSHLSRLAAGEQPGGAWDAAFPELASQGAQEELARRLRRGGDHREFTETGYALEGGKAEVKRTPLGCADARLTGADAPR